MLSATSESKKHLPWGPVWAVAIVILLFVFAQVLALAALSFVLKLTADSGLGWQSSFLGQFAFTVLSQMVIVGVLWLLLRRMRVGFEVLGFGRSPVWADVSYALVSFVVYFVLLAGFATLVGVFTSIDMGQKQELGLETITTHWDIVLAFISLVVLPPIVEEIVFRGFLFTSLRQKLNFWGAAIFTSALFAVPHLLESSKGVLWLAGVDTLILSFVLCYLREKTGALWAPILLHALKNSIAFVMLVAALAV